MAYPKPLSQVNINKMCREYGLSSMLVEKLHRYYEAFAKLYETVFLNEAWQVIKKLEPQIKKKDFINFSSIARREDLPYYIYEINEVYSAELPKPEERIIVIKDLVGKGYGKFYDLYQLAEAHNVKSIYDKPDLLKVAENPLYDKKLREYLSHLTFIQGKNKGKSFNDVIITSYEQFDIDYYKSPDKKEYYRKRAQRPFLEKLVEKMYYWANFSDNPIYDAMNYLEETEFIFKNEVQVNRFMKHYSDFINNSHLWSNFGYTPHDMLFANKKPLKSISFGPGLQEAFADGGIDKDELVDMIHNLGIETLN